MAVLRHHCYFAASQLKEEAVLSGTLVWTHLPAGAARFRLRNSQSVLCSSSLNPPDPRGHDANMGAHYQSCLKFGLDSLQADCSSMRLAPLERQETSIPEGPCRVGNGGACQSCGILLPVMQSEYREGLSWRRNLGVLRRSLPFLEARE